MSYRKLNEKGLGAVEGLLVIIIILLVAFIGYYVWHTQHETNKTLSPRSQSSSAASTPAKTKFFRITEWQVKAPYSGDLTLSYSVHTDSMGLHYALFSSDQLDASDPSCKGGGYGGSVTRYKSSDEFLQGDGEVDSGKTAAEYAKTLDAKDYGHVGDYYYFFTGPQALCSEKNTNIQGQTLDAVRSLLPKLQASS